MVKLEPSRLLAGLVWIALLSGCASQNAEHADSDLAINYATALKEWHMLAEQGDADAQFNLGVMYTRGDGVTKDYAKAEKWYRRAAEQGHIEAQFNLSLMYIALQNYDEGVKWSRLAADHGDANAQLLLAALHIKGEGVPQDYVQAHKWLTLASTRTISGEQLWKLSGDNSPENILIKLEKDMTPEQIAEAQRLAREWKPQ